MSKYQNQLLKKFTSFIDDDSIIEEYKLYEFPENYILIRVFTFNPDIDENTGLFLDMVSDDKTTAGADFRLIPYAKVIANTETQSDWHSKLAPGDIVCIPDELSGVQLNPRWIEFQELMKERPAPSKDYQPPQLLGKIQAWERYAFSGNKLKEDRNEDDFYTFLIPHSFINSKVNKDALKKDAKNMATTETVEMAGSKKS